MKLLVQEDRQFQKPHVVYKLRFYCLESMVFKPNKTLNIFIVFLCLKLLFGHFH